MKKLLIIALLAFANNSLTAQNDSMGETPQVADDSGLITVDSASKSTMSLQPVKSTQSVVDNLLKFKDLVGNQKEAWMKFCKENMGKKIDLLIKQQNEWFDFGKNNIKTLNSQSNFDDAAKNSFFSQKLSGAVSLYKKHMNEWKNLCEQINKKEQDMGQQQESALSKFTALLP